MERSDQNPRLLTFAIATAALLLAAIAFSTGDSESPPTPRAPQVVSGPLSNAPPVQARRRPPALRAAARRFLAAFLDYEVGRITPSVRSALRASATEGFASELLSAPPSGAPSSTAAKIAQLSIATASSRPAHALISGSARRGGAVEEFSFLFEARRGHWLAAGPGE